MQISSTFIYNEFNSNKLNYIYKLSTLIELYNHKYLITLSDDDNGTKYKQNINV